MKIKLRKRGESSTISISVAKDNAEEIRDLAQIISESLSEGQVSLDFETLGEALRIRGYKIAHSTKQTLCLVKDESDGGAA